MIPKIFIGDHHGYAQHFGAFGALPSVANGLRPEYPNDAQSLLRTGLEIPPNTNIDAILQLHRRKMLRRAANRRSAQLSRARKKAHLEDLKTENQRLQRLVDILDSQPELVFCVTSSGRITYVSERTINFIKISFGSGEDSDDDPTHISQILSKESSDTVLQSIAKLQVLSASHISADSDLNMLFSVKEVYFQDASGHPVLGHLRCSKVQRRTNLNDIQAAEIEKSMAMSSTTPAQNPTTTKKSKSKAGKTSGSVKSLNDDDGSSKSNSNPTAVNNPGNGTNGDWNQFKLLTDCVSSLTDETVAAAKVEEALAAATGVKRNGEKINNQVSENKRQKVSSGTLTALAPSSSSNSLPSDSIKTESVASVASGDSLDEEFGNMAVHDLEMRNLSADHHHHSSGRGSPNGSSGSHNSSGPQPDSSRSTNQTKNSTSSETGSEDNNAETDSN